MEQLTTTSIGNAIDSGKEYLRMNLPMWNSEMTQDIGTNNRSLVSMTISFLARLLTR